MTSYLISFDAHAMDHIPDEDMPAVAKAAHAVCQEAIDAGVFVCGGGLEDQRASIVATSEDRGPHSKSKAVGSGFSERPLDNQHCRAIRVPLATVELCPSRSFTV
jgi:hypothetical protein